MQINSFSDYALRLLMQLAAIDDCKMTTRQFSDAHNLSFNHIAKVVQFLSREGYVETTRGRDGGLKLMKPADKITIGEILRKTEAENGLVECMRPGETRCVIASFCGLAPILTDAEELFFKSLDEKTILDTLPGIRARVAALTPGPD